ncbi:hypothetical protein QE152_g35986 [Popillia japonica]|uniref:Uncharacterized protein n=1 Tax=Popillia japonica TaxID=7064 RepID=A0AAW1IE40_POPJA
MSLTWYRLIICSGLAQAPNSLLSSCSSFRDSTLDDQGQGNENEEGADLNASTKGDSEGELQDQTPDTDDSGAHSYPEVSTTSTFGILGTGSFKRAPIMGNRGLEQRGKKSKTYPPKEVTQTRQGETITEYIDIEVLPCSELNLNAYWFQQSIPLLGKIQVNVAFNGRNQILEAIIVKSGSRKLSSLMGRDWLEKAFNGRNQILEAIIVKSGSRKLSSLMGRDWLEKLEINWQRNRQSTKFIAKDKDTQNRNILLNGLKSKYPSVFGQRRGEIKEFQANL